MFDKKRLQLHPYWMISRTIARIIIECEHGLVIHAIGCEQERLLKPWLLTSNYHVRTCKLVDLFVLTVDSFALALQLTGSSLAMTCVQSTGRHAWETVSCDGRRGGVVEAID